MKINAFTAMIEDRNGSCLYNGTGKTKQEAIDAVMAVVLGHLLVYAEREDGITLPVAELEKVPTEAPDGCVLVVMVRSSHSSGYPYDWRYVAIPQGGVIRHPNGKEQKVDEPTEISFLDCNDDYAYELPSGSSQYIGGVWQPTQKVEYNY